MPRILSSFWFALVLVLTATLGCKKQKPTQPDTGPPPIQQPPGGNSQSMAQLIIGNWQNSAGGGWFDFRADGQMALGDGTGRSRDALYQWVDHSSFTVSLPDGRVVTTLRVERVTADTLVMVNQQGTRNEYRRSK